QALLDDLTVPETWFFRGGELFAHLAQQVATESRVRPADQPYRVLSVPCSTGEEPYSLVIALVERGNASGAWTIDGVDLQASYLERAKQGKFGDFAFRQTPPDLKERYFRPAEDGWVLSPSIRSMVRFRQDNLLAPLFLAGEEQFDLILCRNLF